CVQRSADGAGIERRQTFPMEDFWNSGVLDSGLLAALAQIPQREPLGVCFPDTAMFCRGFSLPAAPPPALEKMVRAQVEALLSVGAERLTSTWRESDDPLNA